MIHRISDVRSQHDTSCILNNTLQLLHLFHFELRSLHNPEPFVSKEFGKKTFALQRLIISFVIDSDRENFKLFDK